MKRLIVLIIAATLCGLAASAQEVSSDSIKGNVEVNATARFDANPYFPLTKEGGEYDFGFGNTSIYTFIDGEFGSGWFYSISNHWLGVDWYKSCPEDKLSPLYTSSFYTNSNSWVDWALIGYSLETEKAGTWNFSLGKDMMAIGLSELEDNDVDCHYDISSKFWNNFAFYQWGASIQWEAPNECSSIQLQLSSSPVQSSLYSENFAESRVWPFQDGKLAFAAKYREEREYWTGLMSVNLWSDYLLDEDGVISNPKATDWWGGLALGEIFHFNDVTISLDGMIRGNSWKNPIQNSLFNAKVEYYHEDSQVSVFAKAGMDHYGYFSKEQPGYTLGFAGIGFHWYPIPDSQDLRLHAVLASSNHFGLIDEYDGVATFDELSLSIGITYNLGLHRFWQK